MSGSMQKLALFILYIKDVVKNSKTTKMDCCSSC